jgi:hypothetical protein
MSNSPGISRVIVAVLDGLRSDAIDRYSLPAFSHLRRVGAYSMGAQTVAPSVTACAMTSLLTGVPPEVHGMRTDRFTIPRVRHHLDPVPRVLARAGLPTSAHMARIPAPMRPVARTIVRLLGIGESEFRGDDSRAILDSARPAIERQQRGLILLHWPDADRAGHLAGWMSVEYEDAVRRLDASLGRLAELAGVSPGAETLLIALADHGGGGSDPRQHDSAHPLNRTIPLVIAGGNIARGPLAGPVSLLDVPATVLWALGVPLPASYAGTPLTGAPAFTIAAA